MLNMYWEYAGTRYRHRFRAFDASHGDIKNISFHGLHSFKDYDWSKEPTESYRELMKQRALMLRDQYSYLKFWYSGGSDSHTALNVFLENKIHIDEIVVYQFSTNSKFGTNYADVELNNYALPFIKSITPDIPNTKITIYEFGKDYFDKELGERWLYTKNNLSLRHFYIPKINGKNFCHIFCDADPEVSCENGTFYLNFTDTTCYLELASFRNIELFYTSENFPQLHCKQAHILMQYMKFKNVRNFDLSQQVLKDMIRACLRDPCPVKEPIHFKKDKKDLNSYILQPKDVFEYQNMDKRQKEKYYHTINTKIAGIPIFRFHIGFSFGKYYLGE